MNDEVGGLQDFQGNRTDGSSLMTGFIFSDAQGEEGVLFHLENSCPKQTSFT